MELITRSDTQWQSMLEGWLQINIITIWYPSLKPYHFVWYKLIASSLATDQSSIICIVKIIDGLGWGLLLAPLQDLAEVPLECWIPGG